MMNTVIKARNLFNHGRKVRKKLEINNLRMSTRKTADSRINHELYCINLVKQRNWEGYICSLLLPKDARRSVFAVRAFNAELAAVNDNVSETSIGFMRLHFWKNSLEAIYKDSPPESPVALELHKAVRGHNLQKIWLKRLISAREDRISDQGFNSIRELEDYADNTATSQLCLLLQCLGVNDVRADHVASHVGKSQGILMAIRSVPYYAARRKVLLPMEFLVKHNVSQEDLIRGNDEDNVRDLIFDIASQANRHLEHAQDMKKDLTGRATKAFHITASLRWYLKQLQRVHFNIFHPKLQQRHDTLPLAVLKQNLLKKI